MTRPSDVAAIPSVVFGSAGFAFIWLMAGYIATGLLLYVGSIAAAYKFGWFRRVREWPLFSKIALACGLPLVGLGCFFSTIQTSYSMVIPVLIYASLSLIGGLQLRRLNSDPE